MTPLSIIEHPYPAAFYIICRGGKSVNRGAPSKINQKNNKIIRFLKGKRLDILPGL
jgi:hypothetical protein